MRPETDTDGRSHDGLDVGPHDHHARPQSVSIVDKSTVIPPSPSTFDLVVSLPADSFQFGILHLEGRKVSDGYPTSIWRECAELFVTQDAGEAVGHSIRSASLKKVYAGTYQKQVGDSYLTHKIFDNNTSSSAHYIAVQDAWIDGDECIIRLRNFYGGSATVWIQGQGLFW